MKVDFLKSFIDKGIEIEEGQEKVLNQLSETISKEMEGQNKTFQDAMTSAIGTLEKDDKGNVIPMVTQLKEIAETLEKLETRQTGKISNEQKYQLRKMVKENHTEIIDSIKNKKEFEFTFKAAAVHRTDNVVSNGALTLPLTDNIAMNDDIAVIRYPDNFILNVIPNRQASKVPAQSFKKGQAATEGAVIVVAEGGVKPLLQYKFVRTATARKKYAGRIEWTEEFEMDFEALLAAIVRLFEADVIRAWQNGIVEQIMADATPYVSSVLDGTFAAPDNGLAVVATQSQLQQLNYNADTVLMNPADLVATLYIQNADGDLRNSPYINATTGTIAGMRLFASNTITQGTAYIGDSTVYNEVHSDYIFRTGQYGDQFIENEYTAIGEVFSIIEIAEQDLPAWVEIDLDAVKQILTLA